jgi:PAS domain S-box-containing protein
MSTGQPVYHVRHAIKRSDGQRALLSINSAPLFDKFKHVNGMVSTIENVTDRVQAEAAVQESEERLHRLSDITVEGIVIHEKGVILDANQALATMFGYDLSEIIGQYALKFFTPESGKVMMHNIMTDYEKPYEIVGIKKDGSTFPVEIIGKATKYRGRKVRVGSVQDITDRKRAEKALRESEEKYRAIIETTSEWIWEIDVHGKHTFSNQSIESVLGYTVSEFLGTDTFNFMETEDREKVKNGLPDLIASKEGWRNWIIRWCHKDGTIRYLESNTNPILDSNGNLLGYRGTDRDITDHIKAEESLRQSEEKYRKLVEISPIALWINKDGKIIYINPAGMKILGANHPDQIIGKPALDFIHPDYHPIVKERVAQLVEQGNIVPLLEEKYVRLDGSIVDVEVVAAPYTMAGGRAMQVLFQDITERKRAEEEKEKLQDQLLQAQKMDAIGQLAGGIAHDFNNMIGVILGYAMLIEKQLDPSNPLHPKVKAIITAAERSANLTKQLLGFARKQIANPLILNLNDELSTLQKMLNRLIGEDIDLRILPGKDLWNTRIDPVQIDQILTNLATNARDAIENVGVITIETSNVAFDPSFSGKNPEIVPGEYVMLVFSDTGKGMNRAIQEHIFEPFYTTKPKGQGTGLGLATVFGIVKQNNGYINVYSEPEKGTTVKIYLPRHYGEAETPLTTQEELSLVGIETVLVVEDEEQLLRLTISSLKTYGYTVLEAKSPREAISLCQQTDQKIDLLITDVIMPEMNGKELKEQLDIIKPGMKTIFMSGYTANIVANRGILEEGLQFLQKPFTPVTLAKKVRDVLNG